MRHETQGVALRIAPDPIRVVPRLAALRPRTLIASLVPVAVGSAIAAGEGMFSVVVAATALVGTYLNDTPAPMLHFMFFVSFLALLLSVGLHRGRA